MKLKSIIESLQKIKFHEEKSHQVRLIFMSRLRALEGYENLSFVFTTSHAYKSSVSKKSTLCHCSLAFFKTSQNLMSTLDLNLGSTCQKLLTILCIRD